jgi:hypothetical protein
VKVNPFKVIVKMYLFVYQRSWIPTYNTCFSTTQYSLRIFYLPTQIQMVIVSEKPVLNTGITKFLCPNINNHPIFFEIDKKCI